MMYHKYPYVKTNIMIVLITIMMLTSTESALAQDHNYQFDIFLRDSFLVIQPDLSSFINSEKTTLLKDGVSYAFEYQVTLLRSRHLWGAVQLEQKTEAVAIGYRLLTKEYTLTHLPIDTSFNELRFTSLAKLHHFLADSIEVKLLKSEFLNKENSYKIKLKATSIALTTLNLISSENKNDGSPVKYLFRQFLEITGYGREEKSTSSVPFKLSELDKID